MSGWHDPLVVAVVLGVLVTLGAGCIALGLVPRTVRLQDAFGALDPVPQTREEPVTWQQASGGDQEWDARLGAWSYAHLHIPVGAATRRRLLLRNRTIDDFVAEKVLLALGGLAVPQLYQAVHVAVGGHLGAVPMGVSLVLGAAGFCWPDVALRQGDAGGRDDARQALLSFFDLVTLERLANQSAIASLHGAAGLSDHVVFRRVRGALERARLEQRAPWTDLEAVADELQLPEIVDLVDVLRLDEQGAALAAALRSRVRELRDAQLTREKVTAQSVSESLTLWMVVPSFLTGVLLMAPPLLRMTGLG